MYITRCIASAFLATGVTIAQEPLAEGVDAFLGGGSRAAWFEKGGTIWKTDGTPAGTLNTGVATGPHSKASDSLIVYRSNLIEVLDPSGAVTRLVPPIPYAGFDSDAPGPRLWRQWISNGHEEILEIWEWTGANWSSHFSGVGPPEQESSYVDDIVITSDHYYVRWFNYYHYIDYVDDLFDRGRVDAVGRQLTLDGSLSVGVGSWSEGHIFHGGEWPSSNSVSFWFTTRTGWGDYIVLPERWGCCFPDWTVAEPIAGFPVADWNVGAENVAFAHPDAIEFPDPPGNSFSVLWVQPLNTLLALADQGGTGTVLWYDSANQAWLPTNGFGSPSSLNFLGNFAGDSFLIHQDSTGTSVSRFDEASKSATQIATGLSSAQRGLHEFAHGFLFAADDGSHGMELWFSDGTAAGTRMQADLLAGATGSSPRDFVSVGDHLAFSTSDSTGTRLWGIEPMHLDWTRNPSTGRFYRLTEPTSWTDGQRQARNLGGHLATIRDQAEQNWLWSTFGPANLWIGLEDQDHDGVFRWVSGEPVTFTYWCPGEPNRSTPDEDVVHMAHYPGSCDGGWNDQEPTDPHSAIIERSDPPAPVEAFGTGCARRTGYPPAELAWISGWPRPGQTVSFRLILGPGYYQTGVVLLGFDSASFAGQPLPLELDFLGAPTCKLWVAIDDAVPLGAVSFDGYPSLRVPNSASLIRSRIFLQGLGINFGPDLHTSNAVRVTIEP